MKCVKDDVKSPLDEALYLYWDRNIKEGKAS
jgi:hypothetical protein